VLLAKCLFSLAVPRGLCEPNSINSLQKSGTPKDSTRSLGFLPRVSHHDAGSESRPDGCLTSTLVVIVTPVPSGTGRYQARLEDDDHLLCLSSTPYFDAARKLLNEGYDRNLTLVMRHTGSQTECLRAPLGAAAALTIEETPYGPQLRRWKPFSTLAVAPRIAPNEQASTTLVPPRSEARYRKARM
jgi:hypothetical protein